MIWAWKIELFLIQNATNKESVQDVTDIIQNGESDIENESDKNQASDDEAG